MNWKMADNTGALSFSKGLIDGVFIDWIKKGRIELKIA